MFRKKSRRSDGTSRHGEVSSKVGRSWKRTVIWNPVKRVFQGERSSQQRTSDLVRSSDPDENMFMEAEGMKARLE